MKKLIGIFAISLAIAGTASSQGAGKVSTRDLSFKVSLQDLSANTVPVPNGEGTLKFDKKGDKISNVVFTDAAGKTFRLSPVQPGANGAPQPSCKYPLPDACFATADKNIGLCMCKPNGLTSNSGTEVLIGMLLPAVQKVRAAAARM